MTLAKLQSLSPLLRDLEPEGLDFLESVATEVEFSAGDVIFEEDETATSFYLISSGKVGLEVSFPTKEPHLIETIGPGEMLGVSWLFPPARWSWTARALTLTETVAFDADAVREHLREDRNLALHVYGTVAAEAVRRLHATRVRLLDLYPGAEP